MRECTPHSKRARVLPTRMGFLEHRNIVGRGAPAAPKDPRRFLIDFLPIETRTIQRYGFSLDRVQYFDDVLRPYIDNEDKRKFMIRRDPRDISKIFFFCPDNNDYFEIPYRNISNPSISLWELRACRQRLREQGNAHVDEQRIFAAYEEMQEEISKSVKVTKSTRRNRERKLRLGDDLKAEPAASEYPQDISKKVEHEPISFDDKFDDIEHW